MGRICYALATMKASLLYRIASILLLLFAADPTWGVDSLIRSMQSIHFNANGFERTYWDFFVAFGLVVSTLMVFAAIIALAGLRPGTLAAMRLSAWGFVVCFAAVAYLCWRYVFTIPIIFSIAILLCLTAAAWFSGKLNQKGSA